MRRAADPRPRGTGTANQPPRLAARFRNGAPAVELPVGHTLMMLKRMHRFCFVVAVTVAVATPGVAQTITPNDSTLARPDSVMARPDSVSAVPDSVSARPDSAAARPDSATQRGDSVRSAAGAAAPAPPAEAPIDPVQRAICAKSDSMGGTVHVLAVVFQTGTQPKTRDAALTTIEAKRLGGSDDGVQYVQVPTGTGISRREVEDRMIRLPGVEQVRSVTCPVGPAS